MTEENIDYRDAIHACVTNGKGLFDDAELLRDHHCKHLLTVFMEYLHSDAEQFSVRVKAQYDPKRRLPREVASAVNVFRHEKIRSWESPHSKVLERGDYDSETKRLPNDIDRAMQNAIYVDVSPEGKTVTTPVSVTAEQVKLEMDKCSVCGNWQWRSKRVMCY